MLAVLPSAAVSSLQRTDTGWAAAARRPVSRAGSAVEDASDEVLMAGVARGEQAPFEQLSRRHASRIYRLAYRICGNDSDAHEISQEALMRVWTSAPRWQPSARFTTWLHRVVLNLCFDRRRKPVAAPLEEAGDPADPAPSAFDQVGNDEFSRRIAHALDALPDRQRAAVVLCYYQELPNVEAAAVMAVSVSAIEALLVRARRALAIELAPLMAERRA